MRVFAHSLVCAHACACVSAAVCGLGKETRIKLQQVWLKVMMNYMLSTNQHEECATYIYPISMQNEVNVILEGTPHSFVVIIQPKQDS